MYILPKKDRSERLASAFQFCCSLGRCFVQLHGQAPQEPWDASKPGDPSSVQLSHFRWCRLRNHLDFDIFTLQRSSTDSLFCLCRLRKHNECVGVVHRRQLDGSILLETELPSEEGCHCCFELFGLEGEDLQALLAKQDIKGWRTNTCCNRNSRFSFSLIVACSSSFSCCRTSRLALGTRPS